MEGPTVRPAAAPDIAAIGRVGRSFETDLVYRVEAMAAGGWTLVVERLSSPLRKEYPLPAMDRSDAALVACVAGEVVGFALLAFERWNGRARLEHLFVSASHRGRGVGRALVDAADLRARDERGMRCLWLETQNVNHPAIQFYRRVGFRLCGLDETLYTHRGEVALFFARDLA